MPLGHCHNRQQPSLDTASIVAITHQVVDADAKAALAATALHTIKPHGQACVQICQRSKVDDVAVIIAQLAAEKDDHNRSGQQQQKMGAQRLQDTPTNHTGVVIRHVGIAGTRPSSVTDCRNMASRQPHSERIAQSRVGWTRNTRSTHPSPTCCCTESQRDQPTVAHTPGKRNETYTTHTRLHITVHQQPDARLTLGEVLPVSRIVDEAEHCTVAALFEGQSAGTKPPNESARLQGVHHSPWRTGGAVAGVRAVGQRQLCAATAHSQSRQGTQRPLTGEGSRMHAPEPEQLTSEIHMKPGLGMGDAATPLRWYGVDTQGQRQLTECTHRAKQAHLV